GGKRPIEEVKVVKVLLVGFQVNSPRFSSGRFYRARIMSDRPWIGTEWYRVDLLFFHPGVQKSGAISASWCPHSCEIRTKRLTGLIGLKGLKKVKASCIQWIAVSS
ncbi:MAG: hypothetical protein WBX22_15025, partial [Silvibacterium sp.]